MKIYGDCFMVDALLFFTFYFLAMNGFINVGSL